MVTVERSQENWVDEREGKGMKPQEWNTIEGSEMDSC
jgi:hypothetical protein